MCGICGVLEFQGRVVSDDIEAMLSSLTHRGPDDVGIHVEGPIGLGHRRLSIIDLSPLGHQPMWSADRSVVVVLNGEIYNHLELRESLLAAGIPLQGTSDTEAVANAIALLGLDETLRRCIGMFAMAVWDVQRRVLHLVRDRVGVKPLYYSQNGSRLLFASETRAFRQHPGFSTQIDRTALAQYLQRGYFSDEQSIYSAVRKVRPGTYLTFDTHGHGTETTYWQLDPNACNSFSGTVAEADEELAAIMRSAFQLRLTADVPVGLFLSGGVDSALIASVLHRDLGTDIEHFTIGFPVDGFDETAAAQQIAKHLGLSHRIQHLSAQDAWAELTELASIFDEPFGDASALPTHLLCRFARQHVKVALSGDGGDELFAGYSGYRRYPALWRALCMVPEPIRRHVVTQARRLPVSALLNGPFLRATGDPRKPHRLAQWEKFLDLAAASSESDVVDLYCRKGFSPTQARGLCGLPDNAGKRFNRYSDDHLSLIRSMMHRDFYEWLPDDILVKTDRTSMHTSLECREPLLDHRIVEFAHRLPLDFMCAKRSKMPLRRLLGRYLPDTLINGPKRGFEIPLHKWLHGPWQNAVREHLAPDLVRSTGLLDERLVSDEVNRFFGREGCDPMPIWLLLTVQLWAETWWK